MQGFMKCWVITCSLGVALGFPSLLFGQATGASRSSSLNPQDQGKAELVETVDGDEHEVAPIEPSRTNRLRETSPAALAEESAPIEFAADKEVAVPSESVILGDCCPGDGAAASGPNMPTKPRKIDLKARFGNGFELYTADEEFTMQIHNLTQFDARTFGTSGQGESKDTFFFPREWLIFQGKLTKPIDYYLSFAFGNNAVNLLDVYLNWHVIDDQLQLKIGRYKTPFTYEFFALPVQGLVDPERSLFFNNYGLNRDSGVMALGTTLEKRMDYAVGIFNGVRNGYLDTNNAKDLAAFLNFRPFVNNEDSVFQYLNFGGSTNIGQQNDLIANPQTFRTQVPDTVINVNHLGVPFMTFAPNIRDYGPKSLWAAHTALYYQSLSFISEYEAGFQDYARSNSTVTINVPIQSYYVQAGYFLTGETVTGRGSVQPLRNFDIREGLRGTGAWEMFTRMNQLHMGDSFLSLGDGRPWTNTVRTYSLGTNWYWNQNVKFVFEWQHSWYGNEVTTGPNMTAKNNDAFLFRTQFYF